MRHTREQSQVAVDGLDRRLVTMTNKVDSLERAMADFQAKTEEKLGFTGNETGVKSYCVVLLEKEKC